MVPGFVALGLVAVAFQLAVAGGFYGYLRHRQPIGDPTSRRRVTFVIASGLSVALLGQVAALGAIGSLRTSPLLSFEQALLVQEVGVLGMLVGYLVVFAGFALHGRAGA